MAKTAAIRVLEAARCDFTLHQYKYIDRGGTRASSEALGVDEHCIVKTLILQTDSRQPLIALMHGDRQVSTKALARHIGTKSITACSPATAQRHSGYQVGGTSPFGTRRAMPIYVQESIAELETLYINAGKRGLLARMGPATLTQLLAPELLAMEA